MRSVITEFVLMLSGSVGLTILAKSTVILLLGLFAGALAVRAQASWRHLVFATTFGAVLALPLVVLTIPDLPIEVAAVQTAAATEQIARAAVPSTGQAGAPDLAISGPSTVAGQSWGLPQMTTALLIAWVAGALFLMLSLTVDLLRVRHLRRHGLPSEHLRTLVGRLTIEAKLKPIDILLHENIQAPVTFGFFRPVVMLPADADTWSEADLTRALVHELEHIRRGDWATQLAARAACAFYWFHPLVWVAWRKLCLEAERACDDAVVQTASHTDYAEQLVSLSRQLSHTRNQTVLGMAKRSDLSHRVSSLLDNTRRRGRVGLMAAACSMIVGAFVLVSIGPLRAVAQSSPKPSEPQTAKIGDTDRPGDRDRDLDDDDDDDYNGAAPKDVALFRASRKNALGEMASLIEAGANVNAVLSGDGSPLIGAARNGNIEAVRLLLERGAKPNLGVPGDGNPLIVAAERGHREVVVLLLDRGADIDAGIEGDGNALIMAAGEGRIEIVNLLLDRGADIHKVVAGDENAIIKACEQGQLEMVKLLVSRGADPNSRVRTEIVDHGRRMEEWRSPMSMAKKGGYTQIVEYLFSIGVKAP